MTDIFAVAVIPRHPREGGGQAGIQVIENTPTQWDNTQNMALSATRRFMNIWIPAFAGMTAGVSARVS